eukprot:NODE_3004_length_1069_cov_23.062745_g2756_i0.p1 GENE.NODE_3004_length_1069_cov_23.062745_g2756_i0~~NODE_3004_length_1069_cov_23.062745_g2756_i0.p1  ORF type:complete len:308 (-),score=53.03 NODE_3004_length_1069_cov_23.062745_g2756_i0:145-1035(-)
MEGYPFRVFYVAPLMLAAAAAAAAGYYWLRCSSSKSLARVCCGKHHQGMTIALEALLRDHPKLSVTSSLDEILQQFPALDNAATQTNVRLCLSQIDNARRAVAFLESLRRTKYDSSNAAHESALDLLWERCMPGVRRDGRVTEQWTELGFQGHDPATDFRGGGLLSLLNLLYIAEESPSFMTKVRTDVDTVALRGSWYPFAVASINFTCDLILMAKKGKFNRLLYSADVGCEGIVDPSLAATISHHDHPALSRFCKYHLQVFMAFHSQWIAKRPGTMEFTQFKEAFLESLAQPSLE